MGKVIIYEPSVRGHRLYYVALLADGAKSRGDAVILAVSAGSTYTAEWAAHMQQISSEEIVEVGHLDLKGLEKLSYSAFADKMIVPDGDWLVPQLLKGLGWGGRGNLSLVVMRIRAQRNGSIARRWLLSTVKWFMVLIVNCLPKVNANALRSPMWRGRSLLQNVRDPVTIKSTPAYRAQASNLMDNDRSRRWFAVLGAVTDRKNLPMVASALAELKSPNIGLIVAGKCDASELTKARGATDEISKAGGKSSLSTRLCPIRCSTPWWRQWTVLCSHILTRGPAACSPRHAQLVREFSLLDQLHCVVTPMRYLAWRGGFR